MGALLEPTREADFVLDGPVTLDCGATLPAASLRYTVYGAPNSRRDNVILVCHALSGSARVGEWWSDLFGPDRAFDLQSHCVVGVNVLGSCYGSTGPTSIDPRTGRRYAGCFPPISIRDMVRAQAQLVDHLGVDQLHAVVGGSIGGMQALSWASLYPERVPRCVAVGACPLSAMALALNHLQREMIRRDPAWRDGEYPPEQPPAVGLALARGLAMCSYKSWDLFQERFGRRPDRSGEDPARDLAARFDVGGYLDYQGRSFVDRFDANTYLVISRAMDTFDLSDVELSRIRAKVLLVGIETDWLFPPSDIRALAGRLQAAGGDAAYAELASTHGHDGFLADAARLAPLIEGVLA